MTTKTVNVRDINPLEHITSDIAKSRANYESILNGLVTWGSTKESTVTVRLLTDSDPGFVDYTFPSRSAHATDGELVLGQDIVKDSFDALHRIEMPATASDSTVLRIRTVSEKSNRWKLYENAYIMDVASVDPVPEAPGRYVRDTSTGRVYFVRGAGELLPAISWWNRGDDMAGKYSFPGSAVLYSRASGESPDAYVRKADADMSSPSFGDKWEQFAQNLASVQTNAKVVHGRPYLYKSSDEGYENAAIYIYTGPSVAKTALGPVPYDSHGTALDTDNWYGPVALIPVQEVRGTSVVRRTPSTDISGYMVQALTDEPGEVTAVASVNVYGGTDAPNSGLGMFSSCNYQQWPEDRSPAWRAGRDYSDDVDYTAKMVFHHADGSTKMTNVVNYDGPDLDRGLAVYLPVMDLVSGENGVTEYVEPEDGAMFEFMFRIWPDTSLNGRETADLVINKAHIYVYSLDASDDLERGASIIAKFSMARLTNFYVWSENVAVPNRPVFYKARFAYSAMDRKWCTYDYYQVPDHVFLSPGGFVDPSDRSSTRGYTGVETAGFPLMQDPFGGLDMGRILDVGSR